jgi:hypothetical protein
MENKYNSYNQDNIYNFEKLNFKEADTNVYTLKINSKDRNLLKEPNPFDFEITFNNEPNNIAAYEPADEPVNITLLYFSILFRR